RWFSSRSQPPESGEGAMPWPLYACVARRQGSEIRTLRCGRWFRFALVALQGVHRNLAEPADTTLQPGIPVMAAAESQAIGVTPGRREQVARRKTNPFLQCDVEEFSASQTFWKLQPQHETACRSTDSRAMGKCLLDRPKHMADIGLEPAPDPAQMTVIAAGRKKIGKGYLRQSRTAQCRCEFMLEHVWQMPARGDPSDPVARCDGLRE